MMFGTLIEFPASQGDTLKPVSYSDQGTNMSSGVYPFSAKRLDGQSMALSDFQGKVLLIVNTASRCGFTLQYAELQALHEEFHERGLVIIGFPCNQFGGQEPEDETAIGAFCQKNYGVSFLMTEKISVRGPDAHPLFKYLCKQAKGVFGTEFIKWNFTKFLVNRQGQVVGRYAPRTSPQNLRDLVIASLEG